MSGPVLLHAHTPAAIDRWFAGPQRALLRPLVAADQVEEVRREDRLLPPEIALARAEGLLDAEHAILCNSPDSHAFFLVEWATAGHPGPGAVEEKRAARALGKITFAPRAALRIARPASLDERHAIRPGEHAIDPAFEALPARDDDQFLLDLVLHPLRRGDGTRLGGRLQRSALLALAAGGTRVVRGTTELRQTPEGLVSPALTEFATASARVLFGKELDGWVAGTRVRTYALVLAGA